MMDLGYAAAGIALVFTEHDGGHQDQTSQNSQTAHVLHTACEQPKLQHLYCLSIQRVNS
jgi:hypothetical protein